MKVLLIISFFVILIQNINFDLNLKPFEMRCVADILKDLTLGFNIYIFSYWKNFIIKSKNNCKSF